MNWHFRYSEFTTLNGRIFQPDIPTIDKIIKYYMVPLNGIREEVGKPLYIRSCYRPKNWELQKGRNGTSQHVFAGKGAVDVSLTPDSSKGATGWLELFEALEPIFTRICWYPEQKFFHCDYKGNQKLTFINDKWWKRADDLRIEINERL